jgi:2-oxoglutarate-Fe(II)-dependent oxygenase superfamily protein
VLDELNPEITARLERLGSEFQRGNPFRHVVFDEFLGSDFCRELMDEFPRFDPARSVNERGEAGRKSVNPRLASIGPAYARFDRVIRSHEFLKLVGDLTGIPNLLYDPDYVGGGTHENLNGQDLDSHVDFNYHPARGWHRRLNLIVFLNAEWEPDWGGCLELLRDPLAPAAENCIVTVTPAANRAVLFETTEHSWHGFRRIEVPEDRGEISRRSIAVYFYTKERPAEEMAVSHGTVYFQRPLPERIQPGYALGEPDVDELQRLIARRDTQIKFLYERELEFSEALENLRESPSFRIGRMLTWPARALRRLIKSR